MISAFEYNGKPVSASEAAAIINDRRAEWHRNRLDRQRTRDAREGAVLHQLWAMIRGARMIGNFLALIAGGVLGLVARAITDHLNRPRTIQNPLKRKGAK